MTRGSGPASLLAAAPVAAVAAAGPAAGRGGADVAVPEGETLETLGLPVRLSASPLWDLQRRYFTARGIGAWSTGQVPHYVTTTPYLARAYRRIVTAFVADCRDSGILEEGDTVEVLELGAGAGRFAHRFLCDFAGVLARADGVSVRYVATDFVEATLDFLAAHPALEDRLASGQLELALFDAPEGPLVRRRAGSGGRPAAAQIIVANYVWDGLPMDCFSVGDDGLSERRASISLPRPRLESGSAHLALDALRVRWESGPAERPYYPERDAEAALSAHLSLPTGTSFVMPIGAITTLRTLLAQAPGPVLVLSADRGWLTPAQLAEAAGPRLIDHGSVSLDVNFFALARWAEAAGGRVLSASHVPSSLAIQAQIHGAVAERATQTVAAFAEHLDAGGPEDFYRLKASLIAGLADAPLRDLLAMLRVSVWDSKLFSDLLPQVLAASHDVDAALVDDALAVADEIERRHLELPGDGIVEALDAWRATLVPTHANETPHLRRPVAAPPER